MESELDSYRGAARAAPLHVGCRTVVSRDVRSQFVLRNIRNRQNRILLVGSVKESDAFCTCVYTITTSTLRDSMPGKRMYFVTFPESRQRPQLPVETNARMRVSSDTAHYVGRGTFVLDVQTRLYVVLRLIVAHT